MSLYDKKVMTAKDALYTILVIHIGLLMINYAI